MESVEEFKIQTLEIAGFVGVLNALRLPFGKECRSEVKQCFETFKEFINGTDLVRQTTDIINNDNFNKDLNLISTLVKRGDEHGKVMRGINVWFEINAPRYFHVELDTYRVGAERLSSESTMHIQGKGMATEDLIKMKENLKEGTMQKRVWMMSYQTLRRLYIQRHDHRLPQWHTFCDWIKTLPFADKLILVGLE